MCGLYGSFAANINADIAERTLRSLKLTLERGRDSQGVHVVSHRGDQPRISRQTNLDGRITIPVDAYGRSATIIANARAMPTTEWVDIQDPNNIQPFTSPNGWIVVHNGTISNDAILKARYSRHFPGGNKLSTEIDSITIGLMLDLAGDIGPESFYEGISQLEGSFAILAVHPQQVGTIFYATNYKPLYWSRDVTNNHVQIASQGEHLVLGDQNLPKAALPQYTWGTITLTGFTEYGSLYPVSSEVQRTLSVCSGGLDSVVATQAAISRGDTVEALHFDYACRAGTREHAMLTAAVKHWDIPMVTIGTDFFTKHANSVLTDPTKEIQTARGGESGAEFAHEWVPARNTVFLALALSYAEAHEFTQITLGNNLEECVSGDTIVTMNRLDSPVRVRIADLYTKETTPGHWGRPEVITRVKAITSDGIIKACDIGKIVLVGRKKVFRATFTDGHYIDTTLEHKFLSPDSEWIEHGLLEVGQLVVMQSPQIFSWPAPLVSVALVSSVFLGVQDVYDLSVPEARTFFANDFVVANSGGGYPDNEQEFVARFQALVPYALKPYHQLKFVQPLGALVKHEIVKLGLQLGAPLHLTWSCYSGGEHHCGECGPCYMRTRAFKMNGVKDPAFQNHPTMGWSSSFWDDCVDYTITGVHDESKL